MSKLIIKLNTFVSNKEFNRFIQYVNENYDKGALVLPAYCDFTIIPDDCELEIKKGELKWKKI